MPGEPMGTQWADAMRSSVECRSITLPVEIATLETMQSRDTSKDASDVQREIHRRLGPSARVELAFAMSQKAREISIAGMMDRDPTLSRADARDRLLARLFGQDLYLRATSNTTR